MAGFVNGALTLDSFPVVTSAGDNDDVQISGSLVYVIVSNNNDAITGIVPQATEGLLIFVVNIGPTNNLVIKHDDSGSAVGNRILSYTGSDLTVAPFQTALLGYDTTNSEWHIIKLA